MRGYLFINNDVKNLYLNEIFDAYWKDNLDTSNEEVLKPILKKCKINPIDFFDGIKYPKIKDELKLLLKKLMIKKYLVLQHLLLIIKYFGDKID